MEQLFETRVTIFWAGFALLIVSILFHCFQKTKPALILLICAGFLVFLYAAVSIPMLNVWDERFHALVAKNLMKHPFTPTLWDENIFNLPYYWSQTHIWVHKQPLFLWQAALSYKLFGVNEVAYRFPGVLLCTFVLYAAFRSGKLLGNNNTGYSAAFLIATSLYVEQLISGFWPVDQNDLVFMAYISLSIWAMTEYAFSGKFYWVILTGIFSGCAMLTKEAVGLAVYLIWFLYTLQKYKFDFKKYKPIFISLFITLLIFIPWQIFIFHRFPTEAKLEYQFNMHHFSQVIDGQGGPFSYHFSYIGLIFGSVVPYFIVPGLLVFYFKSTDKKLSLSIIIALLFIYFFFSFAKTKMQSFTTVAELPMYLAIGFLISFLIDWMAAKVSFSPLFKGIVTAVFLLTLCYFRFDFDSLNPNYGFWGNSIDCYDRLKHNKEIFQKLKLPANSVLFNVPGYHTIEAMYYTSLPAYNFIPDESQCKELKSKGKVPALFLTMHEPLPDYLKNNNELILLRDSLEHCE